MTVSQRLMSAKHQHCPNSAFAVVLKTVVTGLVF